MQFQTLFDSVCRCFGHTPPTPTGGSGGQSNASQPIVTSNSHSSDVKRRTNRLELKNKEFDTLFEDGRQRGGGSRHHSSERKPPTSSSSRKPKQQGSSPDHLEHARAVAKAKLAANPSRYRSKRKRSGKAKEDIFRSKQPIDHTHTSASTQQTTFSRLLNPSLALCFATPIRGTEEEVDETVLRSTDASDTNTLNTCEDTISSTVVFDSKYSHVVETRPPMPLFNQFKIGHQKDEIRTIVATDSHSSLKMIKLLQEVQDPHQKAKPVDLEDSSSDSDGGRRNRGQHSSSSSRQHHRRHGKKNNGNECHDHKMESLPDVKAISSSTDSSKGSSRSQSPKKQRATV